MYHALSPIQVLREPRTYRQVVNQKEEGKKTQVIKKGKGYHQNKACEINRQNGN